MLLVVVTPTACAVALMHRLSPCFNQRKRGSRALSTDERRRITIDVPRMLVGVEALGAPEHETKRLAATPRGRAS